MQNYGSITPQVSQFGMVLMEFIFENKGSLENCRCIHKSVDNYKRYHFENSSYIIYYRVIKQ